MSGEVDQPQETKPDRRAAAEDARGASAPTQELAQAERDEEWAFVVLLAWIALLAVIVVVLAFSPWPWGALVGLIAWAWGARGVHASFTEAVARTRELRSRVERPRPPTEPEG